MRDGFFPANIVLLLTVFVVPFAFSIELGDLAETRYILRELHAAEDRKGAPRPGDIIAVSGRLAAAPVVLPDRFPDFRGALMVVKKNEQKRPGVMNGRWHVTHEFVWTSTETHLGQWLLDPSLIEHAGFVSNRASPCADFRPREGWSAECPDGGPHERYIARSDDKGLRSFYEVTPVPEGLITIVAEVSDVPGILTTFKRSVSPEPMHVVVRSDTWPAKEFLEAQLDQGLVRIALWVAMIIIAIAGLMFRMLRRDGTAALRSDVVGAGWRTLVITAPFALFFWPYESRAYVAGAWSVVLFAAMSGTALWFGGRFGTPRKRAPAADAP